MRARHLLSILFFLFLFQGVQAQQMKPADPALHKRLAKYVAENHLSPGGTYIYWDSAAKTPYRFSPADYRVADLIHVQPPTAKVASPVVSSNLQGSNFHLIKDLNTATDAEVNSTESFTSNTAFATLNGVAYFTADDGIHGTELWRSDGTAAGTYLVKDIHPGAEGSALLSITLSGNELFFLLLNDGSTLNGYGLWKTDGTDAGTVLVQSLTNGANFSNSLFNLTDVNGTVYFVLSGNNYSNQLWKSDGTAAGTVLVKDISATDNGYFIRTPAALDSILYFVASTAANGSELWRSDGTAAGTYQLETIDPSTSFYSGPHHLTPYNHHLYFEETDDNSSSGKLWITDGTVGGARAAGDHNGNLVKVSDYDINLEYNTPFTVSNDVLYFSGREYGSNGSESVRSDGLFSYNTTLPNANVTPVRYIGTFTGATAGYLEINAEDIVAINDTIYFGYADTTHSYLYRTDGTDANTLLLKTFNNYYGVSTMTNGNGTLYFSAVSDSAYYPEPWISNGTAAGTVLLKDIYPGAVGSSPAYFTAVNGKVLFSATDDAHGNSLWQSDGTTTQILKDINQTTTASSSYYVLNPLVTAPLGDGILTVLSTYDKGSEVYQATASTETLVKDVFPGQPGSFVSSVAEKNGVAYFVASVPADTINTNGITTSNNGIYFNYALFKTDGTSAGTTQITPDIDGGIDEVVITDNGTLFYSTQSGQGSQIWKSDGTLAGNTLLYSPQNGFFINRSYDNKGNPKVFTVVGNTVYFSATDYNSQTGAELWKSDGTTAGTVVVKDIYAGGASSYPTHITAFNGEVFFAASDDTGTALWKSDGTDEGTVKVQAVSPATFGVSGGNLFFGGYDGTNGYELWKSDGTTAGTTLVKDIVPGFNSSYPDALTDVNGTLFFKASTGDSGEAQLWKSDGTEAGTVLVKDVMTASGGAPNFLTPVGSQLYFLAGTQLWLSDGTDAGTGPVEDDVLANVQVMGLVANGNHIFLSGYTYQYGYELYAGDATLAVLPVTLASFTASPEGTDVLTQWQTASEINTAYFNIQRSTDGVHFTDIGKASAKGTGSTYLFTDANIANLVSVKTIYYRLQITDKDGSKSLSKTVPIDLNLKDAVVLLLPNPVKDVLRIQVNNYTGKASVDIYDLSGKKISSRQQSVQSSATIAMNATSLQSGIYIAKINLNGKTIEKKFVKE